MSKRKSNKKRSRDESGNWRPILNNLINERHGI